MYFNQKPYPPALKLLLLVLILNFAPTVTAQDFWNANWISLPAQDMPDYAVVQARNVFEFSQVPDHLEIDVSAVIRYKLYVNGIYIGQGPANNDLQHYSFDTYDIAPYLKTGKNVLAMTVFSLGEMNPIRYHDEIGLRFILRSQESSFEKYINTGSSNWKLIVNEGYKPTLRRLDFQVMEYFAMGSGEEINGEKYPWNWHLSEFDDSSWYEPRKLDRGIPYGHKFSYGHADISLSPRTIPMMNEDEEPRPQIRKATGYWMEEFPDNWKTGKPITIPKNSETTIWLDQSFLTKGHSHFTFSKGKGAIVEIGYAETLFYKDRTQGNRNDIEDKEFFGLTDRYLLEGGTNRTYSQLLPRTWRYIQVKIKTGNEDLILEDYIAHKFYYPFELKGSFETLFKLHEDIWQTGWRTALLCADETYMDCPYYEQLQYIGDTRVQALISLYAAGDDRLMVNSLRQFAHSITDEGIAQSRYPSNLPQMIPPYALFWINMMHDYFMHRENPEFIQSYLPQIASILYWFENKLGNDFILGPMPWWSYTDVTDGWEMSSPPGFKDGGSMVMTLQFLYGIQEALPLFEEFGKKHWVSHFSGLSENIKNSVYSKAWDKNRNMMADTETKDRFSQHANIFAILTNTVNPSIQSELFQTITSVEDINKANIYFRFYLTRAAQKSGNGDYFIQNLQTWENMLDEGLTTFAEHENRTRSDCHAWSASPNFEFIHTVCGIQPKEKYFKSVLIAPNPGELSTFKGIMPHPKGDIKVEYEFENKQALIHLPENLTGIFRWNGIDYPLNTGTQTINW